MIDFYTAKTPNGHKVSIMLEECGLEYKVKPIDFSKQEQKSDSFLALNPNGKIPTIVDHDNDDFVVFESGALLIYLAEKCGKFLPSDPKQRSQVIQWLMFQMGGLGPMQGQYAHFFRFAPEKIEYGINRYREETLRLFGVMDNALADRDFLAGDYSIADMAAWPWVRLYQRQELNIDSLSNLKSWIERVGDRPACQKGVTIP